MPIFRYYNPYKGSNFYNYYKPLTPYKYIPTCSKPQPSPVPSIPKKEEAPTKTILTSPFDDNVWLDIFGIKLYFDDILILSLLFFLYHEQIKDEGLFLALILLLIS